MASLSLAREEVVIFFRKHQTLAPKLPHRLLTSSILQVPETAEQGTFFRNKVMRNQMKRIIVPIIAACALVQAQAAPLVVFENDFNGALPPEISGAGSTVSVAGFSGISGFSGNYLHNDTLPPENTVLTLTGLPAHDSVDIDFLLALLDSWDGIDGGFDPDFFNVSVDGTTILTASYDNFGGANTAVGLLLTSGVDLAGSPVQADYPDSAYDMSSVALLSFPHSASSLTVRFFGSGAGYQGITDESFAIENLKVTVNTVPGSVPDGGSTAGLLVLGMTALAAFNRKRG